jgi:hypothetical protein
VVLIGRQDAAGCCDDGFEAAADICCRMINFFEAPASAAAWHAEHPQVTGLVQDRAAAHALGVAVFGRLLHES